MPRRRPAIALAILVVVAALVPWAPAGSQSGPSASERREQVRREREQVAAEVDVLEADSAEVEQALEGLERNVSTQEQRVAAARTAADQAARRVAELKAKEQATADRIATLERELSDLAVDAYVHGAGSGVANLLNTDDLSTVANRQFLTEAVMGDYTDVVDQLDAAEEDLRAQREEASVAAEQARAYREAASARLDELTAARDQHRRFADDVEARLDAALTEAASLAALDKRLAAQIAREQAALVARLRASQARNVSSASSPVAVPVVTGGLNIVSVRGIQVSARIAQQLEGLLAAASADGLSLGGGGYRDPQAQIATRRANCGTSQYAIYQMPPSQCHPPTARPGTSMHEQGLAVDFTSGGSLITSRSSAGFQWLAANAGRFGFSNLPSEPWHWSTNGE